MMLNKKKKKKSFVVVVCHTHGPYTKAIHIFNSVNFIATFFRT